MPLVLIGLGGFVGAISRYLVDGVVSDRTGGDFPWGTLVVNVTGSFVLGLLFAMTTERAILPAEIRGPVMIGFIGAYTTFSTYMLESWGLIESGSYGAGRREPRRLDRPRARRRRRRAGHRAGDLMRIEGQALLVRIYIGEADHHDGKPLYQAIVAFLRERGLAGATVIRGIEGFGANAHLHTTRSAAAVRGPADPDRGGRPGGPDPGGPARARRDGRRRADHAREGRGPRLPGSPPA